MSDSRLRANRLLAAMPTEEFERIRPSLDLIALDIKEVLHQQNKPIEHVYFPISGMASILVGMGDGKLIEAAIVGNEGMVGLAVFLGADQSSTEAFFQVAGEAVRMRADLFRAEISQNGAFVSTLQRYLHAYMTMLAQNGACNSQHAINERCARWLLHIHDRVGEDRFELTQEFLSQMLGVRRASVSLVMQTLQKAGLVRYSRGKITIVNREELENSACECYGIISGEYKRLLG
jgi:CRP-like cAMP-binding protein